MSDDDRITIRIDADTRSRMEQAMLALGIPNVSEYVRTLIRVGEPSMVVGRLPDALASVIRREVDAGVFSDPSDCILHYIREGMEAKGRLAFAEVSE